MTDLDLTPLSTPIEVPAGDAVLAVEQGGDGPPVLCLHAGVADRRSFRPLAPFLHGPRLVAYDRRGFGETTYATGPHDEVADAVAVLDALDVSSAVVLGNSQGGRVALELALAHPDRVDGLVLAGAAWTGGPYPDDPPELVELGARMHEVEQRGDLDELNRLEARLWLDGAGASEGRVTGPARDLFLDMNGRALAAEDPGEPVDHGAVWPRLGSLDLPVTVVEGTLDEPGAMVVGTAAVEVLPDTRLEVLEGVAHLPTLEEPDRVATIVRDLLVRVR